MRLLRCHIVNYGCLHDFSYEFKDGMNLINRPNGWGKSTFVSFLCAMLYGLDSTNKRNIQDNERRHYQPWQGGSFGGSLEFEISGRQYRAERFFGRREKDDTFLLYDLKTMLPSQDYSPGLGFELFGIDKAGFLKSTCIPQGKSAPEYNDTLAARLTGMTRSSDDINQYEQAISAIDKALRFYVKTGNRGEISFLQQEADRSAQQLREALQAGHELDRLSSERIILEQQKADLDAQISCIHQQIDFSTRLESQAHYDLLNRQLEQKERELEQIEDFFHDQLPEESDIEFYLQSCAQLAQAQLEMQYESFNDLQMSEFTLLRNLFNNNTDSSSDESDAENPGNSDSEDIFTPAQRRLLMTSAEYRTEAALLFSFDEDFSEAGIFSSPDSLPDPETICCARKLYDQYQDLLSSQKDKDKTAVILAEQIANLESSLENEQLIISDCRRKMSLIQKQQSIVEIPELKTKAVHKDTVRPSDNHRNGHFLMIFSLILVIVCLLAGYFTAPVIGCAIISAGLFFIVYTAFLHRKTPESDSNSCPDSHMDISQSPVSEDENLQTQYIQLETEIQLRTANSVDLENQITQIQNQLNFARSATCSASAETDSCMQQLVDISRQLNLPLDDSALFTSDYLTHLARLNNHLENYQRSQQRQYDQYKRQLAFYNQLKEKYESFLLRSNRRKKLEQTILNLQKDITGYLRPYFSVSDSETPSALETRLHTLEAKLASYKKLLSDMHSAARDLNLFVQEHPAFQKPGTNPDLNPIQDSDKILLQNQTSGSLPELQAEESALRVQYTDCIEKISSCQSQISQKQERAGEYPALEEKTLRLKQQIAEYQERYRILSLTRKYLTKARQDFSDNYLRKIEKNFDHYARFLQKELLQNPSMNSDFHVLVADKGVLRDTGWYSQGTRDLIDLCSRLCIIEELFPEEPPFLVLDDPFVNLDDSSIQNLSVILHNIADKWQILYFTCHSSRNI